VALFNCVAAMHEWNFKLIPVYKRVMITYFFQVSQIFLSW